MIAKPLAAVILSGTERRSREVKSKDPEVASRAMPLQGVLTNIRSGFYSSTSLQLSSSCLHPHTPPRSHHYNTAAPENQKSFSLVILPVKTRHICVFPRFQAAFSVLKAQRACGVDRRGRNRFRR